MPILTSAAARRSSVTFCNLNAFTRDGLEQFGLLSEAEYLLNLDPDDLVDLEENGNCSTSKVPAEELIVSASHEMSGFIANCSFMGVHGGRLCAHCDHKQTLLHLQSRHQQDSASD